MLQCKWNPTFPRRFVYIWKILKNHAGLFDFIDKLC